MDTEIRNFYFTGCMKLMIIVAIFGMGVSISTTAKQLTPVRGASLTLRNETQDAPVQGSKADDTLQYIGMPVGGIGCGTVYLGGDGRLWVWDIFNQHHEGVVTQITTLPPEMAAIFGSGSISERNGANYVNPPTPDTFPVPFEQGFGLRIGGSFLRFQQSDWEEVEFEGTWPIGTVTYRDPTSPFNVELKAFSPFIPLNLKDSSLPVTCMEFKFTNSSATPVDATLSGWLQNVSGLHSRETRALALQSQRSETSAARILLHSASDPSSDNDSLREDVLFEDFEKADYGDWLLEGTAFGTKPTPAKQTPVYQGDLNMHGDYAVNSHATAPGDTIEAKDFASGRLTSPEFTIERNFIRFLIGGGSNQDLVNLRLIVDGEVVRTAAGKNANRMEQASFDVSDLEGQVAHLEIMDGGGGGWANIGVDHIVFCDMLSDNRDPYGTLPDGGTMALAVLGTDARPSNHDGISGWDVPFILQPGEEKTVVFLLDWYFPNIYPLPGFPAPKRHYSACFADAAEIAKYVAENYGRLRADTFTWVDTWYDSTLPEWLLARTLLTSDTLQTANCFIFEDGEFWAWEGIGACAGTCTHVWQYAQGLARLFPSIERGLRERTDFGIAQNPQTGVIRFRGKGGGLAVDGQAGCILRAYREHQMSKDDSFLRRIWPGVRLALECLIREDGNADGILEGAQHNTLDSDWYGPVAWLSGEYLAALRAGEEMALLMDDHAFAEQAHEIFTRGQTNMVAQLFNGEYFINRPDPAYPETINSGSGCLIDQVFGQSWAFQVGLGRILPETETRSALRSLWRYNFYPDVGPFRKVNKPGRWYALPGEAGLIMCTFPRSDWSFQQASGIGRKTPGPVGYFNECMSGFEYQVASHMIYEGTPDLVQAGLAITHAVHDRYSSARRNPYNEIECSDHYARAMASYGVFLAACGFEYNGPDGRMAFAPRISSESFRAAFTAAEGWGTYSQQKIGNLMQAEIALKYGRLSLRTLVLQLPAGSSATTARVTVNGGAMPNTVSTEDDQLVIQFNEDAVLEVDQILTVNLAMNGGKK